MAFIHQVVTHSKILLKCSSINKRLKLKFDLALVTGLTTKHYSYYVYFVNPLSFNTPYYFL